MADVNIGVMIPLVRIVDIMIYPDTVRFTFEGNHNKSVTKASLIKLIEVLLKCRETKTVKWNLGNVENTYRICFGGK
jgi:hypothetical protein